MNVFDIKNFSFSYPESDNKAIDSLDFEIHPGEFLVLCGPSGSGKSTLLRQLKTVLAPHGEKSGTILFGGKPLESLSQREQSEKIGFVLQSPENQIVTDKVWHELAFGLESLGYDTPTIRRRVAEMASFFGIESWFYKNVTELSGGQKQLLNLASVMAMQPGVIILDEPTSQLDPIAASDFLAALGRINRELGMTVVLTEHRLEDAFPMATRVAVMDKGRIICADTPENVGRELKNKGHSMFHAMPAAMKIWAAVENDGDCPVTVRNGRNWLDDFAKNHQLNPLYDENIPQNTGETAIKCDDLWFKYEKDEPDVVRGLTLEVKKGEFLAVLGGNGTGKSTSLKLLAGLNKPQRGKLEINGYVGVLPQNPQTLFVKKTVREDLYEILDDRKLSQAEQDKMVAYAVKLCRLEALLDRHPYDLSGGEQQRAALAKVLILNPDILLLDEPTKGLDAEFKGIFAEILAKLLRRGVAIFMVSHDIEFCARYAHRCALFFDGSIVTESTPRAFFSGNNFYTTSANRIARVACPEAVTPEDVIYICSGKRPETPDLPDDDFTMPPRQDKKELDKPKKLPWWRKLGALVFGAVSLAMFVYFTKSEGFIESPTPYIILIASLFGFALCVTRKSHRADYAVQTARDKRRLSKRTVTAAALILLMIPFTLFIGTEYFGGRKYYFTALLILFETMLPFFLIFEGRKPQARELVLVASLCAIAVAGRAIFFMLPNFKPVMALTIIAGVAFGGETGFLVGAVTMLVSNIMFSQGPWTPWQMFAMGIIGFLAGILFRKGWLRRTKTALAIFGALCGIVIYGGIMNPASALMVSRDLNMGVLMSYFATGIPLDCVHGFSTALFLWVGAEPFLEKLDRIKVKYGLVE
ncbi:MAG: ATP-binding cassette domain-containing protein [Clostridia bacterium]|nr:ATP-binding cassette domain-containing protein [Clostridia bacterium]